MNYKCSSFLIISLIMILSLFGCNSDSNSGGGSEPGKAMAFTADTQSPPDESVYLDFVSMNNDEIILSVNVKKANDIYAAAFALVFDPAVFEFITSTEGNFFDSASGSTTYIAIGGTGSVTVGISLLGSEVQPVTGSGTLCTLVFKAVENGQSRFDFRDNWLFDNHGVKVSGISWFGGLGIVAD